MKSCTLLLLLITQLAYSQTLHWKNIEPKTDASFRGLSVVDGNVAWVSGTKGWVGRSTNAGSDWTFKQVKGFEQCDFRSLYAFDSLTAVIANAGTPAFILRTNDGGHNWQVVYKNEDTAAFFDGVDFWNNKEGIIYGDPIKGRMFLLRTNDGGQSWKKLPQTNRPAIEKGEASFAASGTCIRCFQNNKIAIVTGGMSARLFFSTDKCKTWNFIRSPIVQGTISAGIFSVACLDEKTAIVVGGDYKKENSSADNAYFFYTNGDHPTWKFPTVSTRGYRECVEYISKKTALAVGPTGVDISYDKGITWKPFSDEKGFHVVRKSRKGSLIIIAGAGGKIAILKS